MSARSVRLLHVEDDFFQSKLIAGLGNKQVNHLMDEFVAA